MTQKKYITTSKHLLWEHLFQTSSKDALYDLAQKLHIRAPKSWNKEMLARSVEYQVTEYTYVLIRYPMRELLVLQKAIEQQEPLIVNSTHHVYTLWLDSIVALSKVDGGWRLILTPNFRAALENSLTDIINVNRKKMIEEMELVICGIVNRMGIIPLKDLTALFNKILKLQFSEIIIQSLCFEREAIYRSVILESYDDVIFCRAAQFKLPDPIAFLSDMKKYDYPDFTLSDFDYDHIFCPLLDFTAGKDLSKCLQIQKEHDMSIELVMSDIWTMIQENAPQTDYIGYILPYLPKDGSYDLTKIAKLILDIQNNVSHWGLRGNSPANLYKKKISNPVPEIDFRNNPSTSASSVKTGRNEPCPCGSGKKYKKCCGNN